MEYRCVECGFRIQNHGALFIQYSPGNIRLMKCEKCKAVADDYIECEIMILLIDLVLLKPRAYRHLLFNLVNHQVINFEGLFWKTTLAFLLLDAYNIMVWNQSKMESGSAMSSFSSLAFRCGKILMDLLLGNCTYVYILLLMTRLFLQTSAEAIRFRDILLGIIISSYFKFFLIAMMVWEFPSSVVFIVDILVVSSNTVALKVMTESSMGKCIGVCFTAHAGKISVRWILDAISRDFLR